MNVFSECDPELSKSEALAVGVSARDVSGCSVDTGHGVCAFSLRGRVLGVHSELPLGSHACAQLPKPWGTDSKKSACRVSSRGGRRMQERDVVGTSVRRAPAGREVSGGEAVREEELGRPHGTQGKRGSAKGRKES